MFLNIFLAWILFFFDLSHISAQVTQNSITTETNPNSGHLFTNSFGTGEKFDSTTGYSDVPNSSYVIPSKSISKVRSQDGTNLCQSFCSTTLVETAYCKQEGFADCSSLPDDKRISPISVLAYRDNTDSANLASISSMVESGKKEIFQILDRIVSTTGEPLFFSESCLPFDLFVDRIHKKYLKEEKTISQYNALKKFFAEFESLYQKSKSNPKSTEATTVTSCDECSKLLEEFKRSFGKNADLSNLVEALKTPDFGHFLFTMIFEETANNNPECKPIELKKKVEVEHFPKVNNRPDAKPTSIVEATEVLKEKVKEGKPVSISSLCYAQEKVSKICGSHCVVVTGFKKVKNTTNKEEIELVQIHNSWGTEWQTLNGNGWIRLSELQNLMATFDDRTIANTPDKRKKLFANTFSWVR